MEPKFEERQHHEKQKEQNKQTTSSQNGALPTGSLETRDANVLTIHRPWANRALAVDGYSPNAGRKKPKDCDGNILECWAIQSIVHEPYNNINAVIGQMESDQTNHLALLQDGEAPSEAAATSGSG